MLAPAGASGVVERDHDRECGIEGAAAEVSDLQAWHRRRVLRVAPEQQHARDSCVVEVVAGAVAKRSILTITADAAEHQPRIHLTEHLEADAETVHHPRPEALNNNIGGGREAEKRLTPQRILEVDRQRALVAVERMEHGRVLVDERRHPAHVVAAGGVLDLDDIGAEIREQQRAERPRKQPGQVEDSNVVECQHGRASVAITPRALST